MSSKIKTVSVSGCYWTGSSAVLDILKEHNSCVIVPEEFSAFSYGQFFEEVLYPLSHGMYNTPNLTKNLTRFVEFNKSEPPILFSIIRRFCHLISCYPEHLFYRRMSMGATLGRKYRDSCQAFIAYVKELDQKPELTNSDYICELVNQILVEGSQGALNNMGRSIPKGKLLGVFDQFIAAPYAEFTLRYLPDTKFVNVDRDWRDQYVEMRNQMDRMIKVNNIVGARPWAENLTDKIPAKMEFFIKLRKKVELVKLKQKNSKQIIWLQFEDLVGDTDKVAGDLFDFLDIDKVNWRPGTVFFPDKSRENIGKWRNSPYCNEIKIIEKKLSA